MGIDERDIEVSLSRAERVCKGIRIALVVCLALCVCAWLVALMAIAYGCIAHAPGAGWGVFAYCGVYGGVSTAVLALLLQIFTRAVKDRTPFSEAQANRLRAIALLALVLVVLELFFTMGVSYEAAPSLGYGIVVNDGTSEPTVNLNVGMLVFSGIMYSLSAIFRYAALLQQLSDDTV